MIDIFRNEYNDRYHFFIQFTKHVQRIRNTSHIQFEIKKNNTCYSKRAFSLS